MFGELPNGLGDPNLVTTQRLIAEIIGSSDNINATVTRIALEVISDNTYVPVASLVRDIRTVAEVIGAATSQDGKFVTGTRTVAEAITSVALAAKGLTLSGPASVGMSVLYAFVPENWVSGGELSLYQGGVTRIGVRAGGGFTTVTISDGVNRAISTFATPSGKTILSIRTGLTPNGASVWLNNASQGMSVIGAGASPWATTFQPDTLAAMRDPASTHGAAVGEYMQWNTQLTDPQEAYIRAYLTCKWVTPGCNVNTDLPAKP